MTTYYFEFDFGHRRADFENDEKAVEYAKANNALICYKESDTKDGMPFIDCYERGEELNPRPVS